METYFTKAEPTPETSGNLFAPVKFGTSIHGGWNSPADQEIRKKAVLRSLAIAGIATGIILFGRAKRKKKNNG